MKRIESRTIKLPRLIHEGSDLALRLGLDKEGIMELNARAFDYAKNTAIETLETYPINAFANPIKDQAFESAKKEVGLNNDGLLQGRYTLKKDIDDKRFSVNCYSTPVVSYETVLSTLTPFLEVVVEDNRNGRKREGVRKVDDEAYISLAYLVDKMNGFCKDNTNFINKKELSLLSVYNNERLSLDETITEMTIYLDKERYAAQNNTNADDYHRAVSLKRKLDLFLKDYRAMVMNEHGILEESLEKSVEVNYDLVDGSGVRFLFYGHPKTDYGNIYRGLKGKETVNIASSNGDLNVIEELAFKDNYNGIRGKRGIVVVGEYTESKGVMKVIRKNSDEEDDVRTYGLFRNEEIMYVKTEDVLKTISRLNERCSSITTNLNIDFFTAPPSYLAA